jgi:hypothetical protein
VVPPAQEGVMSEVEDSDKCSNASSGNDEVPPDGTGYTFA